MRDRYDGHPLGGLLIIGAIFGVALTFYLAQSRPMLRAAGPRGPLPMHAAAVEPEPPRLTRHVPAAPPRLQAGAGVAAAPENVAPAPLPAPAESDSTAAVTPALSAFSWSTVPGIYPSAVQPVPADTVLVSPGDRGVVTQAFATAGSAIRSAFKKAF